MAITYENFGELYVPGIKKIFFGEIESHILRMGGKETEKLYSVDNTPIAELKFLNIPGLGAMKEFTGVVENVELSAKDPKSIGSIEYAQSFGVPRKMIDDNLYSNATRWAQAHAQSYAKAYLETIHSPFNDSTDASKYTGFDGLSLASDAHLIKTGVTQSNIGTSALSYDAVIAANNSMKAFKDSNGDKMGVSGKIILCSDTKESKAIEIVNALSKPGTANNDANAMKAMGFSYIASPFMSDDDNWYLIDGSLAPLHLIFHDRVKPELTNHYDRRTHTNLLDIYARFGNGFLGWQWVFCSLV